MASDTQGMESHCRRLLTAADPARYGACFKLAPPPICVPQLLTGSPRDCTPPLPSCPRSGLLFQQGNSRWKSYLQLEGSECPDCRWRTEESRWFSGEKHVGKEGVRPQSKPCTSANGEQNTIGRLPQRLRKLLRNTLLSAEKKGEI